MKITQSNKKEKQTHRRVTQADTLKKRGGNEYDVAFYLVIAVIHRLLLGAAETLTTEHCSFFATAFIPNALRSSSIFPLRGYEGKYVGTVNIKTKQTTAAHLSSAFREDLQGHLGLIHSWMNQSFSSDYLLLSPGGGINPNINFLVKLVSIIGDGEVGDS